MDKSWVLTCCATVILAFFTSSRISWTNGLVFAIHGLLLPHNNLLLLSGLTLVLAGVVAHVVITKRSSKY